MGIVAAQAALCLLLLVLLAWSGIGQRVKGWEEYYPTNSTNLASPHPKFYIYKLPDQYLANEKFEEIMGGHIYGLDVLLPWMIRRSPYYTTNPDEADYFLVEGHIYWKRQPGDLADIRREMQRIGPYWDRKGGKDHVIISTSDDGRGWYADPALFPATMILHYGGMAGENIQLLHHCNLRKRWGDECDWAFEITKFALRKETFAPNYIPGHDIVVSPAGFETDWTHIPYINRELHSQLYNKTSILFYGGEINVHDKENRTVEPWSDAYYSMGGRQTTFHMVGNLPYYAIHTSHLHTKGLDYFAEQRKSLFCLAAAGWGWGMRMKIGITMGCLPVIVQDGIRVEWEEQLPMKDYAVRIPLWMSHKMDDILKLFIRTGRTARMQKVLECAWRLHFWRRPHGRAFELLMCEFKRRLLGEKGKVKVDWDRCVIWCGDDKEVHLARPGVWHNV